MAVGTVTIQLDQPRHLRFTIRALARLEDLCGQPLGPFAARLGETSIKGYVYALLCGLEHELPGLTYEQTMELLQMALDHGRTLNKIAEDITAGFAASGLFEPAKNAVPPAATPADAATGAEG